MLDVNCDKNYYKNANMENDKLLKISANESTTTSCTSMTPANYTSRNRWAFDGNEERYEIWEVKFLGHLRLQNLIEALEDDTPDARENARIYAELV